MRRAALLALALALAFVLGACRTTAPAAPAPAAPPLPAAPVPEPKIALVLGGGAARGFAHVGVIRVLEQEKIPVDLVVGTSVGSLIGALYAGNRNGFELEWAAFQLTKEDIFDFGVWNAVMGMGLARGERLEAFVKGKVKQQTIEELPLPFAAVATDLNWGTRVVLDHGPVARAVRASSAIPGVFEPVSVGGKLLVDGGVVDNIPIEVARSKGADVVVAVDISEDVGNVNIKNLVDVLLQSTNIMFAVNVASRRTGADVLVQPKVGTIGMMDFGRRKEAMDAGIAAAREAAPRIRAAVEQWKARKAAEAAGRGQPGAGTSSPITPAPEAGRAPRPPLPPQ
jgi:NTE family protein